jgi:putative flippase GtrA
MKVDARYRRQALHRWAKFNAVGALGFCLQVSALYVFIAAWKISSLVATALAVEAAVLHNFVWHHFLTWKERRSGDWRDSLLRLLAFNATNGSVSLAGNLLFGWLIVGPQPLAPLGANLLAIAVCSLVNFVLSDRIIFPIAKSEQKSRRLEVKV